MATTDRARAVHERLLAEQAEAEAQHIEGAIDLARGKTQAAMELSRAKNVRLSTTNIAHQR